MCWCSTHIWIWTSQGDTRRIGRRARQRLARAEAQDAIQVSAATLFELVALRALGRLRLTLPPEQWISMALAAGGVRTLPRCRRPLPWTPAGSASRAR